MRPGHKQEELLLGAGLCMGRIGVSMDYLSALQLEQGECVLRSTQPVESDPLAVSGGSYNRAKSQQQGSGMDPRPIREQRRRLWMTLPRGSSTAVGGRGHTGIHLAGLHQYPTLVSSP